MVAAFLKKSFPKYKLNWEEEACCPQERNKGDSCCSKEARRDVQDRRGRIQMRSGGYLKNWGNTQEKKRVYKH